MSIDSIKDNIKNFDKEEILGALGLQQRRSSVEYVLPVLSIFGFGLAAGVGLGMLLAPKSGRQMRRELSRNVDSLRDRARETLEEVARN